MSQNPRRLFCYGMPKCGTTTVAALLDAHPAICLHSQKEPGDFLEQPPNTSLTGYSQSAKTQWLVDFTTTYGLTDQRNRFYSGLRQAGIDPTEARYVICLRDPADLCRSYLRHVAERRTMDLASQLPALQAKILSACDFDGALRALADQAGAAAGFVVRFEDLTDSAGQVRLAKQLYTWLGLEPPDTVAPVWANAGGSARRYPAALDRLAGRVRRMDWARRLMPQSRSRISHLLSLVPKFEPLPQAVIDDTVAWLEMQETVKASRARLAELSSGPLFVGGLHPRQNVGPRRQK